MLEQYQNNDQSASTEIFLRKNLVEIMLLSLPYKFTELRSSCRDAGMIFMARK